MLTPKQIVEIVETLQPTIDTLNVWITRDLIKRVTVRLEHDKKLYLTATDEWRVKAYQEAGGHLEELQQELARFTKTSNAEIAKIFEDAGIKALTYDSNFYVSHGLEPFNIKQSESMIRLLEDTYDRTAKTVQNFTRTTASASQKRIIETLDNVHMKVMSGAQSYTQAASEAVTDLASQQTKVYYPTGHVDTIETAVLRAVRTGVAQSTGNMAIQGMKERDWDVILVSAHLGARYGDGGKNPSNHFWWQGKFYSRTGRTEGLPLFEECTGYGTGEGLCGWNCRHSFGPGDVRYNPYEKFSNEENKKAYDLDQKQRAKENAIRRTKLKLIGIREAMQNTADSDLAEKLEASYIKTAKLLERQNLSYNDFCQGNGLKRLSERIQVAKWTREDAKRSIAAASKKE